MRNLPKNIRSKIDTDQIVMYPDGGATQARWDFTDAANHTMTLRVDPDTGDVTVEESER